MGFKTAGLLAGLGAGLQTVGQSIEQRREEALKQLQQQIMFERQQRAIDERQKAGFEHQDQIENDRQDRQDTRQQAALKNQREIADANRDFQSGEHAKDRSFRAQQSALERQSRVNLAQLNSRLGTARDAASIRLRDMLNDSDTHGITYGKADANGLSEVIIVTNDGQMKPTGRRVLAPSRGVLPTDDGL